MSLACFFCYTLIDHSNHRIHCTNFCRHQVKIDYQPRTLKVGALQQGDYLELLNLFPLEGVHLTLQKLLLSGVSGWNGVTQLLLQVKTSPQLRGSVRRVNCSRLLVRLRDLGLGGGVPD